MERKILFNFSVIVSTQSKARNVKNKDLTSSKSKDSFFCRNA